MCDLLSITEKRGNFIIQKALLSTGKDDWETPQNFFDRLNEEFHFTLDPCSTAQNAKCAKYYTPAEDGLKQPWRGETVFCNPPYSKQGGQDAFVEKCYKEAQNPGTTCVALLPARTDTARFHNYILGKAEIRFVRGRLRFGGKDPAPFPSMVCVWKKGIQPAVKGITS